MACVALSKNIANKNTAWIAPLRCLSYCLTAHCCGLSISSRFSQSFTRGELPTVVSGQRRPVVSVASLGSKQLLRLTAHRLLFKYTKHIQWWEVPRFSFNHAVFRVRCASLVLKNWDRMIIPIVWTSDGNWLDTRIYRLYIQLRSSTYATKHHTHKHVWCWWQADIYALD